MKIGWKTKSFLFSLFDLLPHRALYFTQKHVTRRSRKLYLPDAALFHYDNITGCGSTSVLEFGAGKSFIQNLYLSSLGVRQTVVDLNHMCDVDLVNKAIDLLKSKAVLPEQSPHIDRIEDLIRFYNIEYVAPLDLRQSPFRDDTFDCCISTNTLEHVPIEDMIRIVKELGRILIAGGIMSHKIDYSDHYHHTDKSITPVNFLRFSDLEWARYNHDCHFQNRLRHRDYIRIFEENGFMIEFEEASDKFHDTDGLQDLQLDDEQDLFLTGKFVCRNRKATSRRREPPISELSARLGGVGIASSGSGP